MSSTGVAKLPISPPSFRLRANSGRLLLPTKGRPRFGLIAEEVAKVNPALVLPDKKGKPYTVRYDAVNAMLLNEFLKEYREVQELKRQVEALAVGLQKVSAQFETSGPAPRVANNH
jgi:hypothetical protein